MTGEEKQMRYIIEGTVSEIKRNESNEYTFKIEGTESYSLRMRKKEVDVKYNVLCLNDTHDSDDKKPRNAIIIPVDTELNATKEDVLLLMPAFVNEKKIKVIISEKKAETKDFNKDNFEICSLVLFSE